MPNKVVHVYHGWIEHIILKIKRSTMHKRFTKRCNSPSIFCNNELLALDNVDRIRVLRCVCVNVHMS